MSHEGRTFEDMDLFYKAKRAFLHIARESAVTFKLQQGDLVILDNTRVMHGRTKIIPSKNSEGTARFMQRCYIDRDGVKSRYYEHRCPREISEKKTDRVTLKRVLILG